MTTFATSLVVRERPPQGTPDRRTAAATLAHVGRHQGPEPELHHGVEHKGCKQGPRDHGRQGLPRVVVHGIHVQAQQERHSHQGAHKWSPRENITIIIVHDQFHRVTQQDASGGTDVRGQVRGPWLTKAEYMENPDQQGDLHEDAVPGIMWVRLTRLLQLLQGIGARLGQTSRLA